MGRLLIFLGAGPQLGVSGGTIRIIQVPGPAQALIGLLAGIKLFLVGLINRFSRLNSINKKKKRGKDNLRQLLVWAFPLAQDSAQ